jgi:hypothetical protein
MFEQSGACQLSRQNFLKLLAMLGLVAGFSACQRAASLEEASSSPGKYDFRLISFCGLDCENACPENTYPNTCEGCKAQSGKCASYCCGCPVRMCAQEKSVLTCAHCEDFPGCVKETWATYPGLKERIELIRAELLKQP